MAKSTKSSPSAAPKSKHGGKRVGAGRKPEAYRSPTALSFVDRQALLAETPPQTIETAAQRHARTSIAALVKRLEFGTSDAARVAAANSILDRGYGKPAVDVGGTSELPFVMPGAPIASVRPEIRTEARKYAVLAIEVLRRIAEFGASEGACVSAANALLNRGLGTVAPARMPEDFGRSLGKREQAAEDARTAATGVFAPPPPPGNKLR